MDRANRFLRLRRTFTRAISLAALAAPGVACASYSASGPSAPEDARIRLQPAPDQAVDDRVPSRSRTRVLSATLRPVSSVPAGLLRPETRAHLRIVLRGTPEGDYLMEWQGVFHQRRELVVLGMRIDELGREVFTDDVPPPEWQPSPNGTEGRFVVGHVIALPTELAQALMDAPEQFRVVFTAFGAGDILSGALRHAEGPPAPR